MSSFKKSETEYPCSKEYIRAIGVGNKRQLFIDYRFIAKCDGVELHVNPPVVRGPVLADKRPWEAGYIDFACLVQDDDTLKLWYSSFSPSEDITKWGPQYYCHATSRDGVHWERPNLGLVEYEGSRDNNIFPVPENARMWQVFIDPKAPPQQRYKMLTRKGGGWDDEPSKRGALYIEYSADGIHWTEHPQPVFPYDPDTQNQVFYDPRIDKYVAYLRAAAPMRKVARVQMDDVLKPWPYDTSFKRKMVPTYEFPIAISYDQFDPSPTDIYTPAVSIYPWAQDVYVAFPSVYYHFPEPPKGKYKNDGLLEIQLAVSRDGMRFERPDRGRTYVPLGLRGGPQGGSLYWVPGLARIGDEIYHYYVAYDHSHAEYEGYKELRNIGTMYLAVQRLDGFMSANAAYTGGWLETSPIVFSGRRLELNIDCGATGHAQVELLSEDDAPIRGFAVDECDVIRGNYVHYIVTWQGKDDVSSLAGKVVRLRFEMRNVKLYAFQFVE